jgi:hypothetical protein
MYRSFGERVLADKLSNVAAGVNNLKARAEILKEAAKINDDAQRREIEAFGKVAEANLKTVQAKEIMAGLPYIGKITPYQQAQVAETRRHNLAQEGIERTRADTAALNALGDFNKDSGASVSDMGAPIPAPLRSLSPEKLLDYRVEYVDPVSGQKTVGFLNNPKDRKEFDDRTLGLEEVKDQAQFISNWIKTHPNGAFGMDYFKERDKLETATRTLVEGFIKGRTGIRRASTAAIKYIEGFATNPAEAKNFVNLLVGGQKSRFDEILRGIDATDALIKSHYLMGGLTNEQIDRAFAARPVGKKADE